jgi:aryl-alcohol dehydrogenase-like predicted oxidoreductase
MSKAMEFTRFGRTNLMVSRIGLGAMGFGSPTWRPWVIGKEAARPVIVRALEAGVNLIDTCDFYSAGASETVLGNVLWECASRDSVVLATKAGNPMAAHVNGRGFSRKHLFKAVEDSLQRLKTDYIDIFQTHVWGQDIVLEEVIEAFDSIVRAGKALYVGTAQIPAWTLAKAVTLAQCRGLTAFRSLQCEYNPCHREAERELLPFCRDQNIAVLPFSPIARGFLGADKRRQDEMTLRDMTDDYTKKYYYRDEDFKVFDAVQRVADRYEVSTARVSIAWTLQQPGVTAPLVGVETVEQLDDALGALAMKLTADDIREIDEGYLPRSPRGTGH